jgi:transglutaminase-like putative cysteine protease
VRIDDPAKARSIRFSLAPTRQGPLAIPDTDNQKVVRGGDGTLTVTVAPVRPAGGQAIRYAGHDKAALAMLKPGKYVQSDDPRIVVLARKAVGDARDAAEAIARIEDFTRKYITKKDLSVGYASASEVVVGKEGDCTEHAVFAAALCRAAGIPARVVCGLGYINPGRNNGIFGPHAWVEAFIGGKWVGLDAALNGYDASHLTLTTGSGDPDEFFDITNTLGCFKIARIDVQR